MIIYIEVLLFVNILIHLLTIIIIKETNYLRFSKWFFLTIPLDILYMLLYIYQYNIYLIKFIIPFLFIVLSFKTNLYTYFKVYIIYLIISYLLGGVSTSINISGNKGYFILLIIFIVIAGVIYSFFKRKDIYKTYKIEFKFMEHKYVINAFFDTGCNILYKGYPVIILNSKYKFKIHSYEKVIYTSGNDDNEESVYLINSLKVDNRVIKCYCIFLDIDYDAIIGNNLLAN